MRHKLLFSFFIFLIVALPIRSKDFVLTSGQTVVIACSPSEEQVVRTALEMLGRDIQTVLSSTTQTNEKTISSNIAYYINTIFHNPTGRRQGGCGLGATTGYDRV